MTKNYHSKGVSETVLTDKDYTDALMYPPSGQNKDSGQLLHNDYGQKELFVFKNKDRKFFNRVFVWTIGVVLILVCLVFVWTVLDWALHKLSESVDIAQPIMPRLLDTLSTGFFCSLFGLGIYSVFKIYWMNRDN